jgi:hypothetical protein
MSNIITKGSSGQARLQMRSACLPVSFLLVGGGGGSNSGSYGIGTGGGGGGVVESEGTLYPKQCLGVTVGLGGTIPRQNGGNTCVSSFLFSCLAYGGGAASCNGGSGGGGSNTNSSRGVGYPGQGYPGSDTAGGGAGGSAQGPNGGIGRISCITGSNVYYGGGGGGQDGSGGLGGGGTGSTYSSYTCGNIPGTNGVDGLGGGAGSNACGGSGVAIFRYKSPVNSCLATGGSVTSFSSGGDCYFVHTLTASDALCVL